MFLFCLVFAMFCASLFICALWSPAGKGLTSWLSFVVSTVSLSLSHWYPGSGVVLNCIDSWSLHPYLLWIYALVISNKRTAGNFTWQFSPTSVMFYFILPYLPMYINCPTFIHTKGTTQKVKKKWFICPAISLSCQRIGCVDKPTCTFY